ncbi:MAG: HemK2/MTQ2 family protein methyltransferase [Nanoarchaeota archaeon]
MYFPGEDSLFFANFLKNYFIRLSDKNINYLDMGTGSGILSEIARDSGIKKILAVDIDEESVDYVKNKGFDVIKSDLFSELPQKKFDIITFNPPYLPEHRFDKQKDTSGGKNGDETSLKFLIQAKHFLKKEGKIFLLISSQTPFTQIKKFKPKILATKKIFFEELMILEISF